MAALELLHQLAPLAVANALADDVAGRLGGDAAELLGIQAHAHLILYPGVGVDFAGVFQRNLFALVGNLLRHGFV